MRMSRSSVFFSYTQSQRQKVRPKLQSGFTPSGFSRPPALRLFSGYPRKKRVVWDPRMFWRTGLVFWSTRPRVCLSLPEYSSTTPWLRCPEAQAEENIPQQTSPSTRASVAMLCAGRSPSCHEGDRPGARPRCARLCAAMVSGSVPGAPSVPSRPP